MNPINEALRMARLKARIKQQDLAKTLGVSVAHMSEIERGNRPLLERYYSMLPDEIRPAVVRAALSEMRSKLCPLLKVKP
jgi:transcriptional regulator with XRE-family HTH domain